jgi:CIC family chloride channel protein
MAGLLSRVYVQVLVRGEERGAKLPIPAWLRPALAGVAFGLLGFIAPDSLGGGYGVIDQALHGQMGALLMLGLIVVKLVAIGLTIGGGWPGGTFAPALYLGTMLGGAFGLFAQHLLPTVAGAPSTYTLVGMAALVAGATHAPLTGLALCLELTRQYGMILPAAIACGTAALISQRLSPYSVDSLHLHHEGFLMPWEVADLRSFAVGEVMTANVHTTQASLTVGDLIAQMQAHRHGGYPVLDEARRLVGIITLSDVRALPLDGRLAVPIAQAMRQPVHTITPQRTLAEAALLMAKHKVGRLPVVDPVDPGRLLGIISRSDVLTALPQEEVDGSSQLGD